MSESDTQFEMCEFVVGVELSEHPDGSLDVDAEGHKCPNEAVAKATIETHGGAEMDFWMCEDHLKAEREAENIITVVERINNGE